MKTIKLFLFLLWLITPAILINAQSNIWINGYVFTEKDSIQTPIPFATISLFESEKQDDIAYFAVCGPSGNYTIKPYDYKKAYYVVVKAPGYRSKSFHLKAVSEEWNGKPFSGNASVHVKLMPDNNISTIEKKDFAPNHLPDSIHKLSQYLLSLPNVHKEGKDWITTKGSSIILFINGNSIAPNVLETLDEIPLGVVSTVEYYELPHNDLFGMALNIVLKVGSKASFPTFHLKESNLIY